ncbi:tyrosine-type recombinase/integrase [Aliarcobacter cryaerophilus]|uniref:tyrosine-type recombinase/integrase n=1 Tax=Aliarcobacter cryaerophilus TaxID=28198 RepID=UPI00317296D9
MTLQEAIKLFESHCIYEKNLSNKTIKAYKIDLNQFLKYKYSETLPINMFDKIYIKGYMKYLFEKELKAKSVKRKVGTLKTLFSFFEFEEFIELSPFKKMKLSIKLPKRLPTTLDIKELRKFFKYIYDYKQSFDTNDTYTYKSVIRDIAVLELLFATGIRVSELCNLLKENINIKKGVINIIGKGDKERIIQICDHNVKNALLEYDSLFKNDILQNKYFFINKWHNNLSEQSVRIMIKKYSQKANIKKHITPHVFRHSFATALLEENIDIRYIQKILGHSSVVTTQIYTKVNSKQQKKILATKHPRRHFNI